MASGDGWSCGIDFPHNLYVRLGRREEMEDGCRPRGKVLKQRITMNSIWAGISTTDFGIVDTKIKSEFLSNFGRALFGRKCL
jgi:hypothetical protein